MLHRYRLPILAGLFIGTSYIPFPPWALFFCLAPLWLFALRTDDVRTAFIGGWITQFVLNLIGFHWIAYTAIEFGHFPWWAGAIVLIGFAAIAHLYFPVSVALWVWLNRRKKFTPLAGVFLLAMLFAFFELVFPVIFPWHLGYTWLWARLPAVQTADLVGFEGLNIATITINALLLIAWQEKSRPRRRWVFAGIALTIFTCLNLLGLFRKEPWNSFDAELKVLAVQGNIGNFEKIEAQKGDQFQPEIISKFLNLSRAGLNQHPDADVLLWPETAYPDFLDPAFMSTSNARMLRDFIKSINKPLLTGSYSRDIRHRQTYNSFYFLDPNGEQPIPPYHKTILLAFGEYFPGADFFPWVMKLFPDQSAFGRGHGPMSMNWHDWKFGPQICYEGLYPWFSRQLAAHGAEIFVNVTNDSWFGKPFEPWQHLYMTFARALEFRRPLVRSTNTGYTTAILANGEVLHHSPLHEEWTGLFKIPYKKNPPHTLYEKLEPLWIYILAGIIAILIVFGRVKEIRN